MDFYQSIAYRYDSIFPFSPAQKAFVLAGLEDPASSAVLEIGCATGSLTLELAEDCGAVTGIDIDESMIALAREKAAGRGSTARILPLDMLKVAEVFPPDSLDSVCCFGNTMVHLPGTEQMLTVLRSVRSLLREGAPLHIQVINYDRVLDRAVTSLPTIKRDGISFERHYRYLEGTHQIEFSTILTELESRRASTQQVELYPLRRAELEDLLSESGFSACTWFGGFDRSPLTEDSIPMIVTAR